MKHESLKFEIGGAGGQKHSAEVMYEDGTLSIKGYDYEYDQAMVEFGETETDCIKAVQEWEVNPEAVIIRNLNDDPGIYVRVAVDWAEHGLQHALYLFSDKKLPGDKHSGIGKRARFKRICLDQKIHVRHETYANLFVRAIELCQSVLSKKREKLDYECISSKVYQYIEYMTDETFKDDIANLEIEWPGTPPVKDFPGNTNARIENSVAVVNLVLFALSLTYSYFWRWKGFGESFFENNMDATVYGVATNAKVIADRSYIQSRFFSERLWQVRRLIDVINSNRNKRKWPRLKDTP